MIKTLLKWSIRRFAQQYNYDAAYMTHAVETSTAAGIGLAALPLYSQFSGPKAARDVWAGAVLGSTLDADCGPCTQLIVDMALESQVPAHKLALCLQGEAASAGDVGLGFRFAKAAISDASYLPMLREEIENRYGAAAVTAAAFAASSGRVYPVLKRGLGFGQTCETVSVRDETVRVQHHP